MARGPDINIELLKVYNIFADQIKVSADLSGILHSLRDVKSSGNEIEEALRSTIRELLPLKYAVSHGHIIDSSLNVSKQNDLIIAENIEFTKVLRTADSTEFFLYETIYALGEVKATWSIKNLQDTIKAIRDLRKRLTRNNLSNKTIVSVPQKIEVSEPVTKNPIRNPIFNFAFSVKSDIKLKGLFKIYNDRKNWAFLPNITVVLNEGIYVLVNKELLDKGENVIHLYPEFVEDDVNFEWRFINVSDSGKNLAYLVFCILEHLSNSLLERPSFMDYSKSLLSLKDNQFFHIHER